MSQPFNRGARVPAAGKLDHSRGEFWVENPWAITEAGHNLSAFERHRTYLNVGGKAFVDISYPSGMDIDGDGRAAVPVDLRNNGRQDLIIRQVGGGPLLVYENRLPAGHYLKVSLRGTTSNRQGIGARLVATVEGRQLTREMYPINTYRSQAPTIVHFGLAAAQQVEKLSIRWPSGLVQEFSDLPANQHLLVEEGNPTIDVIESGQPLRP